MTPRERRIMHRKRERSHVKSVRYSMGHRNYVEAFRHLAWALKQATAADVAEAAENAAKFAKAARAKGPVR